MYYALFGKLTATPDKRDSLAEYLLKAAEALKSNPDCLHYLVSLDTEDEEAIRVYETWTSQEAHAASLQDEGIQAIIAEASPLIANMSDQVSLQTIGGKGL